MTTKHTMTDKQLQAMHLAVYSSRSLTHLAITLLSRQAKTLLARGWIRYGSGCQAYEVTPAGRVAMVEAHTVRSSMPDPMTTVGAFLCTS